MAMSIEAGNDECQSISQQVPFGAKCGRECRRQTRTKRRVHEVKVGGHELGGTHHAHPVAAIQHWDAQQPKAPPHQHLPTIVGVPRILPHSCAVRSKITIIMCAIRRGSGPRNHD